MDTRRIIAVVAVAAIVVVLIVAFARGGDDQAPNGGSGSALAGATLDGGEFDLSDTSGQVTVVNFFASWCPPCNQEAPELVAFAEAHDDIAVVAVATSDTREDAVGFVAKYGIEFPVVFDDGGGLGAAWEIEYLPTTLFLDASGREVERLVGGATRAQLEEKLAAVQ